MIDRIFRSNNRLIAISFKNGNNDPTRNSLDRYHILLVEIEDFNVLIDNKPFFDQQIKNKQEVYENLFKYQEIITLCNRKFVRLFVSSKLF